MHAARTRFLHWLAIDDALAASDVVAAADIRFHAHYASSAEWSSMRAHYEDMGATGLAPRNGPARGARRAGNAGCGPSGPCVPVTQLPPSGHAGAWSDAATPPAAGKRHLLQWWASAGMAAISLLTASLSRMACPRHPGAFVRRVYA